MDRGYADTWWPRNDANSRDGAATRNYGNARLDAFWRPLGAVLRPLGSRLGASSGRLGHLGALLSLSWAYLGVKHLTFK